MHKTLHGITWDHTRGYTSIEAVSQRYHELHPEVDIRWQVRSLQAFADEPINELAERFDLLIIDHPWAGYAAHTGVILPLDTLLPEDFMADQASHSVGHSHISYQYGDHQWALAIDAATPVAASRPDLLDRHEVSLPKDWETLVALAAQRHVAIPGIPQDTLMSFYMVCSTLGEDVCTTPDAVISEDIGLQALDMLRDLGQYIDTLSYSMNPIQVYEAMTQSDDYLYSPFAYGYSNYARRGYARRRLKFHDLVRIGDQPLISTIGGTGLAISHQCQELDTAVDFVRYAGSPAIQRGIFFDFGGQPGHRSAWTDTYTNYLTDDYFKDTLPAMERGFLRPRYHGHMYFQDRAGAPIREYMMNGGNPKTLMSQLNKLYHESLKIK